MRNNSPISFLRPAAVAIAAVVLVVGCQRAAPAPATAQANAQVATSVVDIMATDYAFQAPDTFPAGLVKLRLMNHGQEVHHAQVLRLNDGVTFDQLMSTFQAEGDAALRLVTVDGGPGALNSAKSAEVTVDLKPGSYVLACFVAGPDGVPHLAKGMLKPFSVAPDSTQPSVAAPETKATMTLRDFTFDIPDTVPAGPVTYRVVNSGPQPHELNVIKLVPGKTANDVLAWEQNPSTPPPFEAVGGMNGLSAGVDGYMTVDLQPGQYAAICNIPDPQTGLPHAQLGMIREFTVK
jgi:hypothetical protein